MNMVEFVVLFKEHNYISTSVFFFLRALCLLMRIYRFEFIYIKPGACLTIDVIIFVFHVEGIDLLGEGRIANGPLGTLVIYLFWNMTANQWKKG